MTTEPTYRTEYRAAYRNVCRNIERGSIKLERLESSLENQTRFLREQRQPATLPRLRASGASSPR